MDCLTDHEDIRPDPRSGFSFSTLKAAACHDCAAVVWWEGETRLPGWDGLTMSIGHATVVGRISAISAPSNEVVVCRTPSGFRLGWLPQHRWVEAAPGVFMARSGRHVLLASPALELSTIFTRRRAHRPLLAPVG